MKTRLYDGSLGFILGLCTMGLYAIWQAQQLKSWERLYSEQEFEVKVHRDYGTVKSRLVCRLSDSLQEQASKIAELNAQLECLRSRPAVADGN